MAYKPLPTPLHWLYKIYYWFLFAPLVFLVITPFFFSLTVLISIFWPSRAASVGVPWARCIAALIPMRVRLSGLDHINARQSYVVVVNHQSVTDIIALYAQLPVDFRWVMKHELRHVPLIGPGCARMGHVFINRSDHDKAIASLQAARSQLVEGTSIVFFPEGTRAFTPVMLPFKKGAFRMAVDLQLPILPVTLNRTGEIMPSGDFSLQRPGSVDMLIHAPISVDGLGHSDVPRLLKQTREIIETGISMD